MSKKNWSFTNIWNETLLQREEREVKSRSHLWASELGKAPIDLYLRLNGVKETNPPNKRSFRKFEAGNIWEWIASLILIRAGILIKEQEHLSHQYEGLLEVTGRLDFLAGGKPDYKKADEELEKLLLPEIFLKAGKNIVEYFKKNYPDGLEEKVIEIKSTSAFMFEVYKKSGRASDNHMKQCFHYMKAKNMKRGAVIYICRDDCRMLEFQILNPSWIEDEYKKDIETITKFYNENVEPPKAEYILFENGRFTKNWRVEYSGYLTMLYDFKEPADFADYCKPKTARWNRVLGRIVRNEKMTEKNLLAIEEINEWGFDLKKCVAESKKANMLNKK